jgi:hypothetical protein
MMMVQGDEFAVEGLFVESVFGERVNGGNGGSARRPTRRATCSILRNAHRRMLW